MTTFVSGFSWKNSFGVEDIPSLNQTWNDLLYNVSDRYDIIVDWWFETKERSNDGFVYAEGWYRADYIMIKKNQETGHKFEMFAIMEPLSYEVWIMIFVTLMLSGLLYYFLDYMSHLTRNVKMETKMGESVFNSFLISTGHCYYVPTDTPNRIFTFSLTFLFLVIASAYTANLASFMVNDKVDKTINTFQDVVDQKLSVCLTNKISTAQQLQADYPQANYLLCETEEEAFNMLNAGGCDITLTAYEAFNDFKKSAEYNPNCNLLWVGRPVHTSMTSFAIKDSKDHHNSLFRNVIDIHLKEMKIDGTLEKIWEDYRNLKVDTCSGMDQSLNANEKLRSLSLLNMAGIFLIHLIISILAVIVAIVQHKRIPEDARASLSSAYKSIKKKKPYNRRTMEDDPQVISDKTKEECLESDGCSGTLEEKMQLMLVNFKDEMLAQIRHEIKNSQN